MQCLSSSEEFLEFYSKRYKFLFYVQKFVEYPEPWLQYGTEEYFNFVMGGDFVNNRERFPDEIVIDIDVDDDLENYKKILDECHKIIIFRLKNKYNLNFSSWFSGGKGRHIHLFFPELLKMNTIQRNSIKISFLKIIGEDFLSTDNKGVHICFGAARLIQLENAPHRKGGKKRLIEDNNGFNYNVLPQIVWTKYFENKIKLQKTIINTWGEGVPKCISYIEKEDFSSLRDGRIRALFILARFYSNTMSETDLYNKLIDWNKYRLRGHLSSRQIKSTIKGVYKTKRNIKIPLGYIKMLFDELGVDMDFSDCEVKNG